MKNKFKALIAAFIGLFAFSVVAVGVNAEEMTFTVDANIDSTSSISNGTFFTSDLFTITLAGGAITKTACGAGTVSADDESGLTFTNGLLPGGGSRTYTIMALKDITIKFYYTLSDSNFTKSAVQTKNDSLIVNSNTEASYSYCSNVAYVYTEKLSLNEQVVFGSTNSRLVVFGVVATYEDSTSESGYKLTYDYNGIGGENTTQTVESIPELPIPSATGYTFDGWYYDNETFEKPVNAETTLTESTTIYAKWTKNSSEWCTITFDADGGTEVATVEQVYGSTYELPTSTKDGCTLSGWTDGTNIYSSTYTVPNQSQVTLTAVWEENNYIVFDEELNFDSTNISTFFSINGNLTTSYGTTTFNGKEYTNALKIDSNGSISFTLKYNATIYIVFSSNSKYSHCKINDTTYNATGTDNNSNYIKFTGDKDTKYLINKSSESTIGFVGVYYDTIAKNVTASFEAQYDAATTEASTKLRFIATIEGIAYDDYKNISSITFTFDFNETSRTCDVNYVYKSILNGESQFKAAAENTLYTVYTLTNINKAAYSGLIMSNIKLVITYTDGSSTTVSHDDITLPTFSA